MATTRFYKRPTAFRRRVYDPFMRFLIVRFGFGGFLDRGGRDTVQVLCVRGRRTGTPYRRPVGVSVFGDARYVIGFYGHTQWSRNLRAQGNAQLHRGRTVEEVTAVEVSGAEKEAFLRELVDRYHFFARAWLKVHPNRLTDSELQRLVANYPVFRLEARASGKPPRA